MTHTQRHKHAAVGTGRRLWRLTVGEFGFAARYGILPLYGLLSLCYVLIVNMVPVHVRPTAGAIAILTDPAAMGLFFMGAMVLLEQSQRVNNALAISPVRVWEYVVAKVTVFMGIGLAVGLIVGAVAGNLLLGVGLCVMLGSAMFSQLGLMIASQSRSINRFLILSIPVEIVVFVPALLFWFGVLQPPWWVITPGVAAIVLLGDAQQLWFAAALSLVAWNALLFPLCCRVVTRAWVNLEGGRL